MSWPWSELGLSGPADLAAVRHAYAERLKTTHPEEDPEGFQRLNEAYQQARQLARKGGRAASQAPVSRPVSPPRPAERPEEPEQGPEPEEPEEVQTQETPVYGTGEADQPAWRKLDDTFEGEAYRRAEARERPPMRRAPRAEAAPKWEREQGRGAAPQAWPESPGLPESEPVPAPRSQAAPAGAVPPPVDACAWRATPPARRGRCRKDRRGPGPRNGIPPD